MNTPTPETDAIYNMWAGHEDLDVRLLPFCRKLEQERDEARITCESAIAAMTAFQAERDQLRKVCDGLAAMLYYYGKTNGYPKWGKEFDDLNAVIKAYNQLPHVKK